MKNQNSPQKRIGLSHEPGIKKAIKTPQKRFKRVF